jgi:hypothetical protein
MSRYPEVKAHQTAHQPTHLTPRWLERGSADAFSLRRAGETSSLLSTQLQNQCEEHLTANQLLPGAPSNECTRLAPCRAMRRIQGITGICRNNERRVTGA